MIPVPRVPLVPAQLTSTPFTRRQAQAHGVTKDKVRGASWKRVDRGVFAWQAVADGRLMRLRAVLHRLPDGAAFSGPTAGCLRGMDLDPCDPIEVMVLSGSKVTRRAGITVRRSTNFEWSLVQGLPATSQLQTVVIWREGRRWLKRLSSSTWRCIAGSSQPLNSRHGSMPTGGAGAWPFCAVHSSSPNLPRKARWRHGCECCSF